jgi:methylase of polypeptide subunit release factors
MLVLTIIVIGGLAFYAGSQYLTKPADGLLNGDKKLLYVPELRSSIAVFETVWTPREKNNLIRKKLNAGDLHWAKNVLDVGTGSGILGLMALKRGAGRVIATDINPAAVDNARYNARKMGYDKVFEARLVKENEPQAYAVIGAEEKFDLIISDPPWNEGKSANPQNHALYDENWILLKALIEGLPLHLTQNGKAWLYLGGRDALALVLTLAQQSGLESVVLNRYSGQFYDTALVELHR